MKRLIVAEAVVTAAGIPGNAVLVEDGRVAAIGNHEELRRSDLLEERYLGAFLSPGFRDAHIHAVPYSALLAGCSLKSAASIDDLVDRLGRFAATQPLDAPVVATRFDDESLAEGRLPTRQDLDRAVPDRPAVIYRYCGHVAVANSAALAASGIDASTPDPEGGSLDRQDGAPNGVLRETAAGLIAPALARGGALEPKALLSGLERLASLGITSIGAMIGYGEQPSEKLEAEIALWCEVARELPIKVHGITITDDPDQLASAKSALNSAGARLSWLGVKRFADGSLGGHTAAMCSPFADVDTTGTYRLTDADAAIAKACVEMDGMVCIHAIGDRAVGGVLDVFDDLVDSGADPGALRMEHVSVINPEQIERFASLGVTASIQPAFRASESAWLGDRMGPERGGWVYPFASMRDAGIPLAGSSDCPVEPPHPLWGMAAAVDRHGISPAEALSPTDALGMFTSGAARAIREPEPLAPGNPADLVVLDTNIIEATPDQIRNAEILNTYVDGHAVALDPTLPTWVD
ncbi:MAG: amidohydrolase [Acidimicrobiia bacterium]